MFYLKPSIARPLVKFVLFGLLFGILPVLPGEAGILEQMEKELVELADRVRPAVVSLSPYIAKGAVRQGLPNRGRPIPSTIWVRCTVKDKVFSRTTRLR